MTTSKRNLDIYWKAADGIPISQLAEDYDISVNRVRQIIDKVEAEKDMVEDSLYIALEEAGKELYFRPNVIIMTYRRLLRAGVRSLDELRDLDLEDYLDRWFVGEAQLSIIELALRKDI